MKGIIKLKILIVEPDYKNKYPPLGLMKLSTFHKNRGDSVVFVKGKSKELRSELWDRIYITSLFTFHWNITLDTIKYYYKSVKDTNDIYLGGIMATLLKNEIQRIYPINIISGLLNEKGKIGLKDDDKIDCEIPDYSIINQNTNKYLNYSYPILDAYFLFATKGCVNKCKFCAVPILEPTYYENICFKEQFDGIKEKYGEKKDLLLMDNNILAAKNFTGIVKQIKEMGYSKYAKKVTIINGKKHYKKRNVDFNQGVDARLITEENMKLMSQLAINPLRIAFDSISLKKQYVKAVRLAAENGIKNLSNYILFNFTDAPQDFYKRLRINVELNKEFEDKGLKTRIWSFPMKYAPIFGEHSRDRKYIGKYWTKEKLRGIQCILLATHGVVGPKIEFFNRAFGENYQEFEKILQLPEENIIYREKHKKQNEKLFEEMLV